MFINNAAEDFISFYYGEDNANDIYMGAQCSCSGCIRCP